ncbi:MAG: 50S ribosomal protein L17 [bacterium]|nr:50S ribosomal protein L17 [bacterium]
MRHRKNTDKLGRKSDHRAATLSNLVTSLIKAERVTTTERLARSAQRFAEKMITLAKRNTLYARRRAIAFMRASGPGTKLAVHKLFDELGPRYAERKGGYTRIVKLGMRRGDASPIAVLEFVGAQITVRTRKKKVADDALEVETKVSGDVSAAPAPEPKPEKAEKAPHAATPAPEPKPAKAAEAKPDKPAAPKPAATPAEEQPKDRKGGLGRFIKGIFKHDDK